MLLLNVSGGFLTNKVDVGWKHEGGEKVDWVDEQLALAHRTVVKARQAVLDFIVPWQNVAHFNVLQIKQIFYISG